MDDGDRNAHFCKVFRHFQTDKAAASQNSGFRLLILYKVPDAEGILHGAQRENTLTADAGKRRNRRLCAGCEEQFVIGFRVDLSTIQCVNGDGFLCGIDRSYFPPYPHINAKAVPEALRSLQRQFSLLLDHTAHIIRQAVVGIGHIAAALDHDDLGVFIQTADAGSGRSTARHTAYDHNFHLAPSTIAAISDLGR